MLDKQGKNKRKGVGRNGNLIPAVKGGKSPNPKGRPKKENTYSDTLRDLLQGQDINVSWTVNGKKNSLEVTSDKNLYYGIASAQIMEALEGNIQAQKEIIDRTQGKAQQYVKIDNEDDVNEQFRNLAHGLQYVNTSTPAKRPDPPPE